MYELHSYADKISSYIFYPDVSLVVVVAAVAVDLVVIFCWFCCFFVVRVGGVGGAAGGQEKAFCLRACNYTYTHCHACR